MTADDPPDVAAVLAAIVPEGATVTPFDQAERWLPVGGYEGRYEVSDHGRVRSLGQRIVTQPGYLQTRFGQLRILVPDGKGYFRVSLHRAGHRSKIRSVHLLVLEAFVGPRPAGMMACHGDGNPKNNHVQNLRWDTASANALDSVRHGTHPTASKERCNRGHLLAIPNLYPGGLRRGRRECTACRRAVDTVRRARQRGRVVPDVKALADAKYREVMGDVRRAS